MLIIQATKPEVTQFAARDFVLFPSLLFLLVLPTHCRSNVIHNFECWCGSRYLGKTIKLLEAWIKQHVPAYVLEPGKKGNKKTMKQKKKQEKI